MALELTESWVSHTKRSGSDTFTVEAGKWLRLQHGILAEPTTILQEQVPAGKQWTVSIVVDIQETEA